MWESPTDDCFHSKKMLDSIRYSETLMDWIQTGRQKTPAEFISDQITAVRDNSLSGKLTKC